MKLESGVDRKAILAGNAVFKFPRIDLLRASHGAMYYYKTGGAKRLLTSLEMDADVYQSLRWFVGHGIIANRREARLARLYPEAVIRTSSVAGLVNVQPAAEMLDDHIDTARIFSRHLGGLAARLGHMIENPNNFGIYKGRAWVLDGGSQKLEETLARPSYRRAVYGALSEIACQSQR